MMTRRTWSIKDLQMIDSLAGSKTATGMSGNHSNAKFGLRMFLQ